jgi:hypothetical protein
VWAAGNPRDLAGLHGIPASTYQDPDIDSILGAAVLDRGRTLDITSAAYARNDKTRLLFKQVCGTSPPITQSSLQTVPNVAFATVIVSSPSHMIDFILHQMNKALPDSKVSQLQVMNAMLLRYRSIYAPLTGMLTLSGIYINGQGGAVISAGTASNASAKSVADSIAQLVTPMVPSFRRDGNEWKMPTGGNAGPISFAPAMRVSSNNVQIATSATWLDAPEGHSALILPPDAVGSTYAMLINFKFVSPLLAMAAQAPPGSGPQAVADVLKRNNIQNATLSLWASTDPSGSSQSTVRISNLDWKATLNGVLKVAIAQSGSSHA